MGGSSPLWIVPPLGVWSWVLYESRLRDSWRAIQKASASISASRFLPWLSPVMEYYLEVPHKVNPFLYKLLLAMVFDHNDRKELKRPQGSPYEHDTPGASSSITDLCILSSRILSPRRNHFDRPVLGCSAMPVATLTPTTAAQHWLKPTRQRQHPTGYLLLRHDLVASLL